MSRYTKGLDNDINKIDLTGKNRYFYYEPIDLEYLVEVVYTLQNKVKELEEQLEKYKED